MDIIILIEIIFGILCFILLTFGITILILWSRRKLIFTRFLCEDGKWLIKSWKSLNDVFDFGDNSYLFDLTLCTRDSHNRPIATYYKGNPRQIRYDLEKFNEKIPIGTKEIEPKAFKVMMLSKIIKDIFSDDELMTMFIITWVVIFVCSIVIGILVFTHKQDISSTMELGNNSMIMIQNICRGGLRVG